MFNSKRTLLIFLFPIVTCASAQSPHQKKISSLGQKHEVIFFDDFSRKTPDRSKWNIEVSNGVPNDEQEAYIDSSAVIYIAHGAAAEGASNGALVIRPRFKSGFQTVKGKTYDFISGRLNTSGKAEFTYGTLAARMKLPAGAGYWPGSGL